MVLECERVEGRNLVYYIFSQTVSGPLEELDKCLLNPMIQGSI